MAVPDALTPLPLASIVIPNWNGRHLIGPCLDSLLAQTYPRLEIVVVDGGSTDGSTELVAAKYPQVRLVRLEKNLGFAGNVNAGLRAARGDGLALLNNDAEADPDWLAELVGAMEIHPQAGSFASKILRLNDRRLISSAGDLLRANGLAVQRGSGQPDDGRFGAAGAVFSACGGAALYRRAMLEDVGLLDEGFVSYLEDVDLGLRAQLRGWPCRYVPGARVYHRGSATGGGPLASYYVARNSIRLIARGLPSRVLRNCLSQIVKAQRHRARVALESWRGAAARATLRGQLAGLANLPDALRSRRAIQARRTVSDKAIMALLEE